MSDADAPVSLPTAMDIARASHLTGKTIVVTGASSGLGVETARALAAAGGDLILPVRDPAKARPIADQIAAETGRTPRIEPMDLADLASVQACARTISASVGAVDLLVANAGLSQSPDNHLPNGIDTRFATNHLGHFVLVHGLLDRLATRGARIVMLSSAAHKNRPVQLDDLAWRTREHKQRQAYGESKTANILFAVEATRRWGPRGVFANAVLPGSILTGLQRNHSKDMMVEVGFYDAEGRPHPLLRTAEQGAATAVWAAVAPELEGRGGLILEDCGLARPDGPGVHPWVGAAAHATDPETARLLWAASISMLTSLGILVSP